jgi:hypothetical protein
MLSMRNALVCAANVPAKEHFCGQVFDSAEAFNAAAVDEAALVFLCGDSEALLAQLRPRKEGFLVVRELSSEFRASDSRYRLVGLGEVPQSVHNVGVLFPKLFDAPKDYYAAVAEDEHKLQGLKLCNKPGEAFRKGIYLTPVEQVGDEVRFHLLRCSTNLDGPTDNFRATDWEIVGSVNAVCRKLFEGSAELNHVLAQTYHNTKTDDGKERKAKISQHSDKTKDMPEEGLIAFCTFYRGYAGDSFRELDPAQRRAEGSFDYVHGKHEVSLLTRLRFRLKPEAAAVHAQLAKQFDVTFFPNSVFVIPLATNRLYTHETVPSTLPVDKIPVRLGYVIRCSNTRAVHKDSKTFIVKDGAALVPLQEPTHEGLKELSEAYFLENTTTQKIDYRDRFFFSMNSGDYLRPAP